MTLHLKITSFDLEQSISMTTAPASPLLHALSALSSILLSYKGLVVLCALKIEFDKYLFIWDDCRINSDLHNLMRIG